MGFNNRIATPLDYATSPLLPQADSSQPHDIPTGINPTTAKLHDYCAWFSANGVFFSGGTTINSDITINGNLVVTLTFDVAGAASFGSTLIAGGAVTAPRLILNGTQPATNADPGANTLHSTNVSKFWAYVETDGAGNTIVNDAFNLASATITGSSVRLTFVRAFASASIAVVATTGNSGSFAIVNGVTATYVDIGVYNVPAAALRDPATFSLRIHVAIMGRH